jgi:hypothetical protein
VGVEVDVLSADQKERIRKYQVKFQQQKKKDGICALEQQQQE